MEISEVLGGLSDRFEGLTTADMEDIREFMMTEKLEGSRAEDFYFCIKNNHESRKAPNIAKVRRYWFEQAGYSDSRKKGRGRYDKIIQHNNEVKEKWKTYPLEKVIDILVHIRKKPKKDSTDTEFWVAYGDLFREASAMKDKGIPEKDRMHRLGYVLQCINAGEEYDSAVDRTIHLNFNDIRKEQMRRMGNPMDGAEVTHEEV